MARQKASVKKVDQALRDQQMLAFRLQGLTYDQIGKKLKITAQAANKRVLALMVKMASEISEEADKVRELELMRLDRLMLNQWDAADTGDFKAVEVILKIMDRRAKLLGIDAPTKTAQTDTQGNDLNAAYENMSEAERIKRIEELTKKLGQSSAK